MQRERALAEAEGRAREARENEDINRRTLTLRLEEERKKLVEAINTTFGCGTAAAAVATHVPFKPCLASDGRSSKKKRKKYLEHSWSSFLTCEGGPSSVQDNTL